MIVLDASVLIDLLLRTHAAAASERHIFARNQSLHAPALIDLEVCQVLRRFAAEKVITPAQGKAAIRLMSEMPIERHPHEALLSRIWELRGNLTAYDAAYIALAEALNAPLLTRDRKLASSQRHQADVLVIR
jgi:predicted nucleic acid-binding protein